MSRFFSLATFLFLAGCSSPNDPGAGGVTRREADELNEAAAALDSDAAAPSVANTQIPIVPAPPSDPEIEAKAED
jgi:hypothetical protein